MRFQKTFSINFLLVLASIVLPISFFQIFDFFYSKNSHNYNPFQLRDTLNNGKSLYIRDKFGWYDLSSEFFGESRYGKYYFFVKTDKNGFRINHLIGNIILDKEDLREKVFFIGDSFTFGVAMDWEKSFVGILNKEFNINAVNAGVNSYSPTTYKFKLKGLIENGIISKNQKIVIGLDISDVFDEATRWTEFNGKPAIIKDVTNLSNNSTPEITLYNNSLNQNKKSLKSFYTKNNFKLTHQIYFGLEAFVKRFVDNIQVRNNDRSKFTHKEWELINHKFSPLGIEQGLKKIRSNLIDISQFTSKNNNKLYLLVYPWPAQLSYESLFDWPKYVEELCIEIDCSGVINTFPAFFSYKEKSKSWQEDLYISGDMHFNEKGNYILAEIIANEINE